VSLSGGSIPAGGTCTFAIDVTGTATGAATNTTGAVQSANGGSGNTAADSLTVVEAPAITSAPDATFVTGHAGSVTIAGTGFPSVTLSRTGGALPDGVHFDDNGDGTGTLAGTPAAGSGGIYRFTITAANGVAPDATQAFTLTVNQPPSITSAPRATFLPAGSHAFTVTSTGFPAPALTHEGALPAGLEFTDNRDGTATLAGTPAAGTYTVAVRAANGVAPDATQSLTLTVPASPPSITPPSPPTVGPVLLPSNRFRVSHVRTWHSGRVRFRLRVPGPGIVDVLETAPRHSSGGARAAELLQPKPWRFTFARRHVALQAATTRTVVVHPNARGRRLLARHAGGVRIRLWVSYTPAGGRQRDVGLCGVPVSGRARHARSWRICGT
jgi:hypothetical protein